MRDLHDASRSTLLLAFLFLGLAVFLAALSTWILLRPDPDGTPAMLLQIAMGAGVDIGIIGGGLAGIEHVVNTSAQKEAEARRRHEADDAYDVRTALLVDLLDVIGALYAREADRVLFDALGSMERWEYQEIASPEHTRIQRVSDELKWLSERGLTPALGGAFKTAARRVREVRRKLPGEQQPSVGADLKRLSAAVRNAGMHALDSASDLTSAAVEHVTWVPKHDPSKVTSIKGAVSVAHAAQAAGRSALLAFEEAAKLYDPKSPYADPSRPFAQRDHHLDKLHGILACAVELSNAFADLTAALLALREVFGELVDPVGGVESLQTIKELLPVGPDPHHLHYPVPWEGSS